MQQIKTTDIAGWIPAAATDLKMKTRQQSGLMGLIIFLNHWNEAKKALGLSHFLNNWQGSRFLYSNKRPSMIFYIPQP
jgi:hypothetical protein